MPRKSDKRTRLIEAATTLIAQQGYNITTLNDIASESDVPLGNVYYYFKTKKAIGEEVIKFYANSLQSRLSEYNNKEFALDRLLAAVDYEVNLADITKERGCPLGGLSQELCRLDGELGQLVSQLINDFITWVEKQFIEMGCSQKSHTFALQFVAQLQGIALITHTNKQAEITALLCSSLKSWLKTIDASSKVAA